MLQQAKAEIIKHYLAQYERATKREKSRIIDIIVEQTGYTRKHAIHVLNDDLVVPKRITRRRASRYQPIEKPLERLWGLSSLVCGRRLEASIPDLLTSLKRCRQIDLTDEQEALLLTVSSATIDRLLRQPRKSLGTRGHATTKPGTLLKYGIPIRTFADWNENKPGFIEVDLVAHCGDSVRGEYINTLTMTDVATGWTVCAAFMGRSERFCVQAIGGAAPCFPFPILGIDSDSGSEFINAHLRRYCEHNSITFTRGRPEKKNDSCFVEQKNWDVVRKTLGYARFDTNEQLRIMRRVHELLAVYQNYFQPSQKLISKRRVGAKLTRKHDAAQTPFRRLLARDDIPGQTKQTLQETFDSLDVADLFRSIQSLVNLLYRA